MEEQDNLYDLFKHSEHKLDERPTPMAWDRLEQRLDNRKSVHKRLLLRNYAAAASLLLVVSVAVFFAISDSNPSVSLVSNAKTVESLGDIAYAEEAKPARPILMSHKEKVYYYQQDQMLASKTVNKKPGNSAQRDGKLDTENKEIALLDKKVEYSTNLQTTETTIHSFSVPDVAMENNLDLITNELQLSNNGIAENLSDLEEIAVSEVADDAEENGLKQNKDEKLEEVLGKSEKFESPKIAQTAEEPQMTMETIAKEDLPVQRPYKEEKSTGYRSQDKISTSSGAITLDQDELKQERAMAQAEKAKSWKPKNKKSKAEKSSENFDREENAPVSPTIATSEPSMVATERPAPAASGDFGNEMEEKADDIPRDLNLQSNQIQYEAQSASNYQASAQEIDQFNWILGNWKDDTGQSLEQWEKTDELTIKGRGHFIVNGDTLFTEGMKIKQIDDNLYYIVAVDDSKSEVFYKLKSFNNQLAVFENSNLEFPNQVIIQQNSNNNFTTTLQNSDPSQISGTQQNYLLNRNAISNEKATRNLHRSY